ncbi:MAG: hypothetical protein QOJ30_5287 [Pseudonocardiales bacterium]|nr:hypothetical protein [Pseudonocardiales bacterium]
MAGPRAGRATATARPTFGPTGDLRCRRCPGWATLATVRDRQPHDLYAEVLDQAAADAVRALLADPADGHTVRAVVGYLGERFGPDAVRDLAEVLAADVAELMTVLGEVQGRDPHVLLDEWTHDEPRPDLAEVPEAIDGRGSPRETPG